MTFVVQPTEEGETRQCPACDVDLIGRWTDYKGKYEDKLQWQTLEPRQAHYDKNGNCKGVTPEQSENEASKIPLIPKNISLDETLVREPQKSSPQEKLETATQNEMIARIFDMTKEMYHDFIDRKTSS